VDIFHLTIKKQLLKVFENNNSIRSRNEFMSKYRHDPEYVSMIEKKLNMPKEDIYDDCIFFIKRLNTYIMEAMDQSREEIEKYNKDNDSKVSSYGKEFLDSVSHKLADRLKEEKELY